MAYGRNDFRKHSVLQRGTLRRACGVEELCTVEKVGGFCGCSRDHGYTLNIIILYYIVLGSSR